MYVYFDVDERSLLRYMQQRDRTRRHRTRQSGDNWESTVICNWPTKRTFPTKESWILLRAKSAPPRVRREFAACLRTKMMRWRAACLCGFESRRVKPYQALLIPERALATDQSVKYVYVVGDDGIATRRTVELGPQRGDMRIVSSGLKAGERVIVKGLQRVRPGQKVEATSEPDKVATYPNQAVVAMMSQPLTE